MARVRMGKMITEIKTDAKVKRGVCYGILILMRVDLIFYCAISIPRAHADTIPNVVEPTIVKVDEMNGCDIKQFSSKNQENYYFEVCSDSDDLTNQVAKTDDSAQNGVEF
jgi:hypothetical protein